MSWNHPEIRALVELALNEDIGAGDMTSKATVPEAAIASGRFFARQEAVVAGVELLPLIYDLRGGIDRLQLLSQSGDAVRSDQPVAAVSGRARTLLECERVALNFIQRLSGIATLAHKYAAAVQGTKCRVLDTRKTTPGFRRLEKLATAAAGVVNHRMGLYDRILIKNNHITAAGGVTQALEGARAFELPVEIEVRDRAGIDEALAAGAHHLLLDNMTPAQAAAEIEHIAGRATIELSGNIDLTTIAAYARTGADFVSCGAITHSAVAADFNFRIEIA